MPASTINRYCCSCAQTTIQAIADDKCFCSRCGKQTELARQTTVMELLVDERTFMGTDGTFEDF